MSTENETKPNRDTNKFSSDKVKLSTKDRMQNGYVSGDSARSSSSHQFHKSTSEKN